MIRERSLSRSKANPFSARSADEQELILVPAGCRCQRALEIKKFLKIPTGKVTTNRAIEAVLPDRNAPRRQQMRKDLG